MSAEVKRGLSYDYIDCKTEVEWLEARKGFETASEVPMIMGDFKGKSSVRLWLEKQGYVEKPDLSDNEDIQRGKRREPIIRREFADRHPELTVTHHPIMIYVSKAHPFISATLDGECIANKDCGMLAKSAPGHVEIKSVRYTSARELEEFQNLQQPPAKYYEQALCQMHVYGSWFCYIVVELEYCGDKDRQGELPDHFVKDFFFYRNNAVKADMKMVVEAVCEYHEKRLSGKMPDTVLTPAETAEVVVLKADVEVGKFFENFDQMKEAVARMVEPYKDAVFTEDTAKDAQSIHAELKSMYTSIEDKRKAIKKVYLEPYNAFEAKAKELEQIILSVSTPIKAQLDSFEQKRQEEKRRAVLERVAKIVEDNIPEEEGVRAFFDECGGVPFSDKWLNKTTRMSAVEDEALAYVTAFLSDYEAIVSFVKDDPEMQAMLFAEYARTGNLAETLKARDRIMASREQARINAERRRAEEEARKAQEKPVEKPHIGTVEQNIIPKTEEKEITFTFRASHTSKQEWTALVAYMKEHGFKFERL